MRLVVVSSSPSRLSQLVARLRALGHEPAALLTTQQREPADARRPYATASLPSGVDVLTILNKYPIPELLQAYRPDAAVCWGFPWLITPATLSVPRYGWVNLHGSILPRHRGPLPVAWALRNGDPLLGVTWHRMDSGFDTGPILAQGSVPVSELDVDSPWEMLAPLALDLLPHALKRIESGDPGDKQPEQGATYEGRFEFDDFARIDPDRSVREIIAQVAAWRLARGSVPFQAPVLELDGQDHGIVSVSAAKPSSPVHHIEAADGILWITKSRPLGCRLQAQAIAAAHPLISRFTSQVMEPLRETKRSWGDDDSTGA